IGGGGVADLLAVGASVLAVISEDELFGGERGIGVEHVDLLAVGAGGLEEAQAVGLVLGEGLLVAVDDLVSVVVEVAEGDEAAALTNLIGVGDGVGLRVPVECGFSLFSENALFAPVAEGFGGAGVAVFLVRIGGELLAQDDADEVVGA